MLRNVMVSLRQGGIRIALDDFGTGFSSVGLVKNLPFDTIKVDRSFVQQIENDDREKKLLNNFTDIAGTFGAEVCVEGIETTGMRDIIKDYGIHSFQGYYYSKPISIDELLEKVKEALDIWNAIANKYKAIMNAYLDIVPNDENGETGPLDGEGEGDDEE